MTYPIELSNNKIKDFLTRFGVVKYIRNEKYNGDALYKIENGIITAVIIIKNKIPSYITIDGLTLLVTYPNQQMTCMICDGIGHEKRDCPRQISNRIKEIRRPAAPIINDLISEDQPSYSEMVAGTKTTEPKAITKRIIEHETVGNGAMQEKKQQETEGNKNKEYLFVYHLFVIPCEDQDQTTNHGCGAVVTS
ncbi:hypothetical protein HHI36_013191 [Cryptolaemus montrouzieri]|uniref:CCHC-type domain-containing protein n=1 Tax=Cryptolaemus montrouzieri TaxID=559131 RepID=A0ABD2NHH8_9CUCU